jgi:hypothetical protein
MKEYVYDSATALLCRRLRPDFDVGGIKEEFDPALWEEGEVTLAAGRDRYFLVGRPGDFSEVKFSRSERLPNTCQFLQEFLPGKPLRAHFSTLGSHSRVSLHVDGHVGDRYKFFEQTIRIHLPIETNEKCVFYVDGELFRMREGEVWVIDNRKTHAVINRGKPRLHLIVDLEPDEKLLEWLDDAYPDESFTDETLKRSIVNGPGFLERMQSRIRKLFSA